MLYIKCCAEAAGFEPTDPYGSEVFKTSGINHSPTPPNKNNVRLPPRYEPLFTNATCPHIHSSVVFYGNLAIQRAF